MTPLLAILAATPPASPTDAAPEVHWTLQHQLPMWPAIPTWVLVPVFIAAGLLVWRLYAAQQKIAPRRTVLTLTGIRVALLLLLFILLLQPVVQWTHTSSSAGTLWLMLDQSNSMATTDTQATPIERLRWADGLGLLKANTRPSKLELPLAGVLWLQQSLPALKAMADAPPANEREEAARLRDLTARLQTWNDHLATALSALRRDTASGAASTRIAIDMESTHTQMNNVISRARNAATLRDVRSEIPWESFRSQLQFAAGDLTQLADQSDRDFLARHAADADVAAALDQVAHTTRSDLAYQTLINKAQRLGKSLGAILPAHRLKIVSFADGAHAMPQVDLSLLNDAYRSALIPGGKSTNLAAGLQAIAEQIDPNEQASVLILSDGRQNVPADATESARLLAARNVHVYGLLIGSHEVSPDAAVEQINAPDWIHKGDTLRATALIRLDGLADKRLKVDFRQGDRIIDTQFVTAHSNQATQRLNFTDTPPEAAGYEYTIHVEDAPGEVNHENNAQTFRVAVKKDQVGTLLVEEQPRWEWQFLRGNLARDSRAKFQSVLLSPARIPDITAPAYPPAAPTNPGVDASLPATREAWQAFDMIILGDVPPASLNDAAQQAIAAAVRDRGATLIIIAGHLHMPAEFNHQPLADLLPVEMRSDWTPEALRRHIRQGFRPSLAPEGAVSVLGQLGLDADSNSQFWTGMPPWYWHAEQTIAKPAASVIWAIGETDARNVEGAAPDVGTLAGAKTRALVSVMPVGLGRVMFIGSDQTWRLRQVAGDDLHQRFWEQVFQWAVGSDLPAGGRFVRFGANRPRYSQGEPVTITARVLRENLTPYIGLDFKAVAKLIPPRDPKTGVQGAAKQIDIAPMKGSAEAPGYYRATFAGLPAGIIEISLQGDAVDRLLDTDPTVTSRTLRLLITAEVDLEDRNLNTDPELLQRIAQAGQGVALDGAYADVLAANLPELHQTTTSQEQAGLFADPKSRWTLATHAVFMGLFALLLTLEWGIRKWAGMV